MSDLIRREDAIKAFQKRWARTINYNGVGEDLALECEEVINNIPSADRPQGEWIEQGLSPYDATVRCSECGRVRRDNRVGHTDFCNSCGADMRGADDE